MRRCVTRHHPSEDRISLLPDEILISILSLLPFKEAARTSALSKRWIHVWTYFPVLDFDATNALYRERDYYVRWVDKVLQSHNALAMDEFRVYCDLGSFYKAKIDKWLQYAFAKNVGRLELNLSNYEPRSGYNDIYTFSGKALGLRSLISSEINSFVVHFRSLKILIFKRVNVSEKYLKFFLHYCKFLEQLVLHHSGDLENLEVHGPDLALRHLELCFCPRLKSLIVHNVNLISLKVSCTKELVLKDVPMLVDFCLWGYEYILKDVISQFSCCLSKLEVLTLQFKAEQLKEKIAELLPQLSELKQLTLEVAGIYNEESMIGLADFVRASPNLEKFVLKINDVRIPWWHRKLETLGKYPHHHLKVVELHGCYGNTNELELIMYFLDNAVALEKIIINTSRQWYPGMAWFIQRPIPEEEKRYRNIQKILEQLIIPSQMRKVHVNTSE